MQTNPGGLEAALDLPQASVRQRALRVLQLLGIEDAPAQSTASTATRAQPAPEPDLLGGLTDDVPPGQNAPSSNSADMLGRATLSSPPAILPQPFIWQSKVAEYTAGQMKRSLGAF